MTEETPGNGVPACPAERPPPTGKAAANPGDCVRRLTMRGLLRSWTPLIVICAIMVVAVAAGMHRQVTLENVVLLHDRFHRVLADHPVASVAAYIAVYIAAAALSLPGCPLVTAAGGLLFGWLVGGIASVIGATAGATILFLIARSAIGGALGGRSAPWLTKLRRGFSDDALSYLLFLRLVPAFPFWFVNVAPAILGVPLKTFVLGTFLGIIPATFAFASAGAGLESVILAAKADFARCVAEKGSEACRLGIHMGSLVTSELLLALLLLGVVALIPVALRKWRTNHAAAE
jgi:uncharacterized membrane protein YdjX (TVP38/TMEM64 family)